MALPTEFARIARHFRPLAGPGALDLTDDAAVIAPPPGRELVLSADTMIAGTHFLAADPPDLVARKLLRRNLSDLAAMGATPLGYLLTLAVPRDTTEAWFTAFAAGLAADQAEYGIALLGGDTAAIAGPVSRSLTILGTVAPWGALRRAAAQGGDGLFVTGTIGDGTLGLLAARGALADADGYLAWRYRLPRPRVALGQGLAGIAHAAIDVSDGLVQDVGHLCRCSGLGCTIEAGRVPLSPQAAAAGELGRCLTGGDDYELALAVPAAQEAALAALSCATGTPVARIGVFAAGAAEVIVLGVDGARMSLGAGGWSHFG